MTQIAERVGCSQTTVSFVLNDSPHARKLPEETKQRVLRAAREMGYRPNGIARALVTGNTRVVALISTQPERPFAARMLCGAMEQADEMDYFVKLLPLWKATDPDELINKLLEQKIVGVLLQGARGETFDRVWKALKANRIPAGIMGSSVETQWGNRVVTDDIEGSRLAVRHLHELGHRKICFLSGSFEFASFVMRRDGFLKAMDDLKLPVAKRDVFEVESYSEAGRTLGEVDDLMKEIQSVFDQSLRPYTAAYCANEYLAALVVRAARAAGLLVPGDFSVVGYSDSAVSKLCDPPLTTIAQPQNEIGRESMRMLVKVVEAKNKNSHFKKSDCHWIPTELVVRESSAPPREN